MKIGFFGTPDLASGILDHLCCNYDVVFAVSSHDKPQGRSKQVCKTPVKSCAERHCLDILQPRDLRREELADEFAAFNADIFIVFAYGHIIPRHIFDIPPLGTVNMHPSLLPRYRGAAPAQWALINGEEVTGVTIQMIDEALDAGDIVCQEEIPVSSDMTACELYEEVIPVGKRLLDRAIAGLADGTLQPVPQDHSQATYCGKLTRERAEINWSDDAQRIHNTIRGMNPKPVAWTTFRGTELKIWRSTLPADEKIPVLPPGELARLGKRRLLAGTGEGTIEILELQPVTKKRMDAASFLNGVRLEPGERCTASTA